MLYMYTSKNNSNVIQKRLPFHGSNTMLVSPNKYINEKNSTLSLLKGLKSDSITLLIFILSFFIGCKVSKYFSFFNDERIFIFMYLLYRLTITLCS